MRISANKIVRLARTSLRRSFKLNLVITFDCLKLVWRPIVLVRLKVAPVKLEVGPDVDFEAAAGALLCLAAVLIFACNNSTSLIIIVVVDLISRRRVLIEFKLDSLGPWSSIAICSSEFIMSSPSVCLPILFTSSGPSLVLFGPLHSLTKVGPLPSAAAVAAAYESGELVMLI